MLGLQSRDGQLSGPGCSGLRTLTVPQNRLHLRFQTPGCVFDTLLILIRVCMNTKALCFKAVFHIISDSNYFSGMDRVHDDSFPQHCVKILHVCAHVKFSGKRLLSFH